MGNKRRNIKTERDKGLRRYYQALMNGTDPRAAFHKYYPYVNGPLCMTMLGAYEHGGGPALEAYITRLSLGEDGEDDAELTRLANIILQDSSETESCTGILRCVEVYNMGKRTRETLTEGDKNLIRLYQRLMEGAYQPGDLEKYGPYTDYYIALQMAYKHWAGGVPALKAFIVELGREEAPEYKRLAKMFLHKNARE
jgi:hypothetical protein